MNEERFLNDWSQQHLRCHYKHETLIHLACQFSSVTQLCPTLRPYGLQHARLPCPSLTPGACSNSCPSSRWCHPTILSSVIPFSPCLPSFPASGSFLISQLFASGGQSIGASALASVLPMNIQGWFHLGWTGWISLLSSPTPQFKSINSSVLRFLDGPTLTYVHDYRKDQTFVSKVMSLLFNMLSRLVIAVLPRSKCLLTSWLQSPSAVILEPKKRKSVIVSIVSPPICHEVIKRGAMVFIFWTACQHCLM